MRFLCLLLSIFCGIALALSNSTTRNVFPTKESCQADVQKFCSDPKPHRHEMFRCLEDRVTELSTECAAFVQQKQAAKEACGADVQKLCPGSWGYRASKRCVFSHYNEVSVVCQQYVQSRIEQIPADACDQDTVSLCPTANTTSTMITCLKNNFHNVSGSCKALIFTPSLSSLQEGLYIGHDDHDGKDHHKGGHGRGKKEMRRKAMEACGADANAFCQAETSKGRWAVRDCLQQHISELSATCSEFLQNMDESDGDSGHGGFARRHNVLPAIILITLAILVFCLLRRRCKRRRMQQQFMMMQQQQSSGRMIPMIPLPSAPQPTNNQTVIYAASPYTGGSPVTAQPMMYNPDGMTIA